MIAPRRLITPSTCRAEFGSGAVACQPLISGTAPTGTPKLRPSTLKVTICCAAAVASSLAVSASEILISNLLKAGQQTEPVICPAQFENSLGEKEGPWRST